MTYYDHAVWIALKLGPWGDQQNGVDRGRKEHIRRSLWAKLIRYRASKSPSAETE